MGKPVTKGELKKALAPMATKKYVREAIQKAIEPLATKQDLEDVKRELHQAIGMVVTYMDARFTAQSKELAQHVQAVLEEVRGMIRAVDDKYADLPGRVSRLEAERGH